MLTTLLLPEIAFFSYKHAEKHILILLFLLTLRPFGAAYILRTLKKTKIRHKKTYIGNYRTYVILCQCLYGFKNHIKLLSKHIISNISFHFSHFYIQFF